MTTTTSRAKGCLPVLAGLAILTILFTAVRFYGGKWLDQYERPWAYSTTEPLLVGQWEGRFKDPDGVAKTLRLTIDLPETDEERLERASRKKRLRNRRNKGGFDGSATVTSRLGREDYEVYGAVDRQNDHVFSLNFDAVDGRFAITPNFYIHDTDKNRKPVGRQSAGCPAGVCLSPARPHLVEQCRPTIQPESPGSATSCTETVSV